jgi:hypothetical protein
MRHVGLAGAVAPAHGRSSRIQGLPDVMKGPQEGPFITVGLAGFEPTTP